MTGIGWLSRDYDYQPAGDDGYFYDEKVIFCNMEKRGTLS